MFEHILSKVYRKLQNSYDKQRYRNIGVLGEGSVIQAGCDIVPPEHLFVGKNSVIGSRAVLWSTKARIIIGDYVIFGPQVTCITGNHITDRIGKHISEFKDEEKDVDGKYDADIVIDEGVWVGANVTILAGVHIAKGCVIAAGAVVTQDTIPYGVYGGVPARLLKKRFSDEQVFQHELLLNNKNIE